MIRLDQLDRPQDVDFAFSEEDVDHLWRAQHATSLLANLPQEIAEQAGIGHDSTAAVADLVRCDLLRVLNRAQRLHPSANYPTGADNA